MKNYSGFKLLLLASCVVMIHGNAHAQQPGEEWGVMPTPDIVFDGSVLQALDPASGQSQPSDLAPVKLIPPSALNRTATPAEGSLTMIEAMDPSAEKTAQKTEPQVKPVITFQPAPKTVKEAAQNITTETLDAPKAKTKKAEQKPAKVKTAKTADVPVPARKPVIAAPVVAFAEEDKPQQQAALKIIVPPEAPAIPADIAKVVPVNTPEPETAPVEEIIADAPDAAALALLEPAAGDATQAVVPTTVPTPTIAKTTTEFGLTPELASVPEEKSSLFSGLAEKTRRLFAKNDDADDDITAPPAIGHANPAVKAPTDDGQTVAFEIKDTIKTTGGLNPSSAATAPAPVTQDTTTIAALSETMTERDAEKPFAWRQENPTPLYEAVPVPPKRPNKTIVPESFVQAARKNLVETYTVMKREGDKMPAVPKDDVTRQNLPAPRLSVADIAGDPLASRILDMSPEEVALALNNMAPAAGAGSLKLPQLPTGGVAKPRIVREMGEWNRKAGKTTEPAETQIDAPAQLEPVSLPSGRTPMENELLPPGVAEKQPSGKAEIGFDTGAVALSDEAAGKISRDIVTAMKDAPGSRVQIVAYSAATDGKESSARRTSLSRALSVRSYLISQGIDATRMDVRAMGVPAAAGSNADKVDMIVVGGKKS